jgi:hypothetical protein
MNRTVAKKTPQRPKAKNVAVSKKVAARKHSTVSVWGYGVSLEWVPISGRDFKCLTMEGAKFVVVRAHFSRGKGMGGPLNGRCDIYVNDRKLRDIKLGLMGAAVIDVGESVQYLLVAESWEKGDFGSTEIDGSFDKRKLLLGLTRYRLKDGTNYNLVSFGYDADDELEFDVDTDSKETNYFVMTREGKRHPVKFKDD